MNDIANIIKAIALLVSAVGVPLVAISKFGPAIKEYNKLLMDTHKRAKEDKNITTNQRVASNTSDGLTRLRRQAKIVSGFLMSLGMAGIVSPAFITGPVTSPVVVLCSLSVVSVVFGLLIFITDAIFHSMVTVADGIQQSIRTIHSSILDSNLKSHGSILDSNLTLAQMLVSQATPLTDKGKEEERPTNGSS